MDNTEDVFKGFPEVENHDIKKEHFTLYQKLLDPFDG